MEGGLTRRTTLTSFRIVGDGGQLCPDYIGLELGLGEGILVKAIAECTGRLPAKIKADYKKEGDLGIVAMVSPRSASSLGRGVGRWRRPNIIGL